MNDRFIFRILCKWGLIYSDDEKYTIDVLQGIVWKDCCDDHVGHENLMQCNGQRDKNGVLIFEGDIVEFKYQQELFNKNDLVGVFKYNEDELRWELDVIGSDEYTCLSFDNVLMTEFEIIGNIYQDSHLLDE